MKNLLLLCLFSFSALASNWMPISKIQSQSSQAYQLESECLKSGEVCLDVGNSPDSVTLGYVTVVPESWGPKLDIEVCSGDIDCTDKLSVKECASGQKFIDENYTEVYCSVFSPASILLNSVGYNAYLSQKNALAQLEAGKAQAKRKRECGDSVIDLLLVRNASKNLNTTQIKQMVSTFSPIKSLLETASLVSAKEEIALVSADGVLVTEGDKVALSAAVDVCIALQ